MILSKPATPTNDARHATERQVYLAHCQNIATILSASFDNKMEDRQELIDQYLTTTSAEAEE